MSDTTRRAVLAGAAGITAASILAACGDEPTNNPGSTTTTGGGAATSNGASGVQAKKSQVPVGGGLIMADKDVVITQPTDGTFKAFTATCTHQQCPVASVSGGTINCTCHGSKYSITDGSVKNGPATRPLTAKQVTANGDDLTVT
jgi:Rieske Fe-S protein